MAQGAAHGQHPIDPPDNEPRASLHAAFTLLVAETDPLDPHVAALHDETGVGGLKQTSRAVLKQRAIEAQRLLFRRGAKLLEEEIRRLVA